MTCSPMMQAEVETTLRMLRGNLPRFVAVTTDNGYRWDCYSRATKALLDGAYNRGIWPHESRVRLERNSDCAALAARVVADLNAQLERAEK